MIILTISKYPYAYIGENNGQSEYVLKIQFQGNLKNGISSESPVYFWFHLYDVMRKPPTHLLYRSIQERSEELFADYETNAFNLSTWYYGL